MNPGSSRKAFPWGGLLIFSISLLLCAVEIFSLIYYLAVQGDFFYSRPAPAEPTAAAVRSVYTQFDPLFGFGKPEGLSISEIVESNTELQQRLRRTVKGDIRPEWLDLETNNFGFFSPDNYPADAPNGFTIGIFGGSVADQFSYEGRTRLLSLLSGTGQSVQILNFAQSAYKQPQQLLVLSYFLSIGQRFDLVVNIDGFNEAVVSSRNEERYGVDFSIPHGGILKELGIVATAPSDETAELFLAQLTMLRAKIAQLERARGHATFATEYFFLDRWLKMKQAHYDQAAATLPDPAPDSEQELLRLVPSLSSDDDDRKQRIVRNWARSSEMMASLAESAGGHYIHVLQPNQYFGARTFSSAERAIALNPKSPYRRAVETFYPLFQQEGRRLVTTGIDFIDATTVFDEVSEAVYTDNCCHFTQSANEMLADLLAERIRPWLPTD